MVFDGPMAELVEKNFPAMVGVDLVESLLGVEDLQTASIQRRDCLLELVQRNSTIMVDIDFIENDPAAGVILQVLDEVFELTLGNVFVSHWVLGFQCGLRNVECLEDDWLKFEEFWELEDIPHALVGFSQTEVPISVGIEGGPVGVGIYR